MGAELQGNWFNNKSTTIRSTWNITGSRKRRASVCEQLGFSTRKHSSILNVLRTSLNRILHKDLHLQPYKTQYGQHVTSESLGSVSKRGSNPELKEHIREEMQNISRNHCQSVN